MGAVAGWVGAAFGTRDLTPNWADLYSNEKYIEEESKDLDIAIGMLADTAVKFVNGALAADFTAVLGLVNTLKGQVTSMSWSANKADECKTQVKYDRDAGQFALVCIKRQSSKQDVKISFFGIGGKTYTVKLHVMIKALKPDNDAARQVCQDLVNQQAGDLVNQIEEMKLFP